LRLAGVTPGVAGILPGRFGVDPGALVNKLRPGSCGAVDGGRPIAEVRIMAGNETGIKDGPGGMKAHVATYDLMIGMLKWGAVVAAILVGIVLWLIA
jgi:hypothetical protein